MIPTFFVCLAAFACIFRADAEDLGQAVVQESPTPTAEAPSEKTIQKAVMRCLSSADEAPLPGQNQGRFQGLSEEGEARYCLEQKKACQLDPGGFVCRNFVRDYVR